MNKTQLNKLAASGKFQELITELGETGARNFVGNLKDAGIASKFESFLKGSSLSNESIAKNAHFIEELAAKAVSIDSLDAHDLNTLRSKIADLDLVDNGVVLTGANKQNVIDKVFEAAKINLSLKLYDDADFANLKGKARETDYQRRLAEEFDLSLMNVVIGGKFLLPTEAELKDPAKLQNFRARQNKFVREQINSFRKLGSGKKMSVTVDSAIAFCAISADKAKDTLSTKFASIEAGKKLKKNVDKFEAGCKTLWGNRYDLAKAAWEGVKKNKYKIIAGAVASAIATTGPIGMAVYGVYVVGARVVVPAVEQIKKNRKVNTKYNLGNVLKDPKYLFKAATGIAASAITFGIADSMADVGMVAADIASQKATRTAVTLGGAVAGNIAGVVAAKDKKERKAEASGLIISGLSAAAAYFIPSVIKNAFSKDGNGNSTETMKEALHTTTTTTAPFPLPMDGANASDPALTRNLLSLDFRVSTPEHEVVYTEAVQTHQTFDFAETSTGKLSLNYMDRRSDGLWGEDRVQGFYASIESGQVEGLPTVTINGQEVLMSKEEYVYKLGQLMQLGPVVHKESIELMIRDLDCPEFKMNAEQIAQVQASLSTIDSDRGDYHGYEPTERTCNVTTSLSASTDCDTKTVNTSSVWVKGNCGEANVAQTETTEQTFVQEEQGALVEKTEEAIKEQIPEAPAEEIQKGWHKLTANERQLIIEFRGDNDAENWFQNVTIQGDNGKTYNGSVYFGEDGQFYISPKPIETIETEVDIDLTQFRTAEEGEAAMQQALIEKYEKMGYSQGEDGIWRKGAAAPVSAEPQAPVERGAVEAKTEGTSTTTTVTQTKTVYRGR